MPLSQEMRAPFLVLGIGVGPKDEPRRAIRRHERLRLARVSGDPAVVYYDRADVTWQTMYFADPF